MKKLTVTFIISLLASTLGFADSKNEQVIKTLKSYEKALNGNDVTTIIGLYSSSPVFMPQHAPAQIGRDAVKLAYENVFKTIDLDIVFKIHEVEVIGDTAWARTSSEGKTKILANGADISEGNNELFVFKKEKGQWKIHQYLFATNLPRQ